MFGCGECGAFGKLASLVERRERVVNGVRYAGKVGAVRCKKCGAVWHDADDEAAFARAVDRVAKGLDVERANDFEISRVR